MQLFQFSTDPTESVKQYYDTHVSKTLVELAQCFGSIAHNNELPPPIKANGEPYGKGHINHPLVSWMEESFNNFMIAVDYMEALNLEYRYRFDKQKDHASYTSIMDWLNVIAVSQYINQLEDKDLSLTLYAGCPPWNGTPISSENITDYDIIFEYMEYYNTEKAHLRKYTKRPVPDWVE